MIKKLTLLLGLTTIILFAVSAANAEAVLTIVSAEVVPQFPQPGKQVTISFTVVNNGDQTVPDPTSLAVEIYSVDQSGNRVAGDFVQAIPWYTDNINTLAPGETQVIPAKAILRRAGRHTAFATIITEGLGVDQVRVVPGNQKKSFEVVRPANLVLAGIRMNNQGQVILTMYNEGGRIPDEHFQLANIRVKVAAGTFYLPLSSASNRLQRAASSLPFGSGSLARVDLIWPAAGPSGFFLRRNLQNKVEATIDDNRSIFDNRRANNTKIVWVGGKPDLVVCFKKNNHNKPNQRAYYPPVVKNIGYATAGPSKLRFWIADDGVKTYSIPQLAPGAEYKGVQRKVYWIRVKSHKFRLTVDNNNAVRELDEFNNVIEGTIIVGKYGVNSETLCSDAPGMKGWN